MSNMCLVVAHEHLSSREVLAAAIKTLRPAIDVLTLEPDLLDAALLCVQPRLIICSRLSQAVMASGSDWIVLYPNGEHHVELQLAGHHSTADDLDLSVLLAYIDRLSTKPLAVKPDRSRPRPRYTPPPPDCPR